MGGEGKGKGKGKGKEIGDCEDIYVVVICWIRMAMEISGVERWQNEGGLGLGLGDMPELCIVRILAFTTPKDVCRLAAVSQLFRRAATSDAVWEVMLPLNYGNILSRALNANAILLPSKKELYFRLCHSILIDAGTKRVWLQRSTGKICYILSARDLSIAWGDDDRYWHWVCREDSRFEQVAHLGSVCWLEIKGRIDCTQLSPNTAYTVSFVLKFSDRYHGWSIIPVNFSVTTQDGDRQESTRRLVEREEGEYPQTPLRQGNDGWMEFVAGDFGVQETGDGDEPAYVEFKMEEVESGRWKSGLLLDGVKIEPKQS